MLFKPACSDGLVGIEIHYPKHEFTALKLHKERSQERDQRWRGQRNHHIKAWQQQKSQRAGSKEAAEVQGAAPLVLFSKREGRNADVLDSLPSLALREAARRIVVAPIACDHCYFVTLFDEAERQISKVLRRRYNVRIKALIKEEKLQGLRIADCGMRIEDS